MRSLRIWMTMNWTGIMMPSSRWSRFPGGWSFSVGKETIEGKLSLFALVPIPVLWGYRAKRSLRTGRFLLCLVRRQLLPRSGCRRGWRRKLRAGRSAVSIQIASSCI